jgi:hypothetical protein
MNKFLLMSFAAGSASVGAVAMYDDPVNLQAVTPGVLQIGHSNISGTSKAGFFQGNGSLLTNLNGASINSGIITLTGTSSTYIIRGSNNSGDANASGVIGLANSPTGVTYGGWFESKSNAGRALFGYASGTAGATYGVYGVASGNGGRAMFGLANNATGNTYGGWFQSNSPDGIGLYGRNVTGGIGIRAESSGLALEVNGRAQFNGFTGVNRSTGHGSNEVFGIGSNLATWTGTYVTTPTGGLPYYGYYNVEADAYTYLSGSTWRLYNNGTRLSITADGSATFAGGSGSNSSLIVNNPGTGNGVEVNLTNAASTSPAIDVTNAGIGSGVNIVLANASNGARGVNVQQTGVGPGVFATSAGGTGAWGITSSISAAGVLGDNSSGEAVVGRNSGTAGVGSVVGRNDGIGGYGVRGFATKDDAIGVLGQHGISGGLNGFAVRGNVTTTNGTGIGVYGSATGASQYALYGNGRFAASGTKSFLIDHPRDPANKMLAHYCTEGNQPLNAYSGNATTDGTSSVWVSLPEYVEDINRDFRYQLTVIGDFAQAIIGSEVKNGKFQIKTSKPNVKVSWRVEGVRNDNFVQEMGAPDEIQKPANWKGKYLNPEYFNVREDKGIFYLPPSSQPLLSEQGIQPVNTQRTTKKRVVTEEPAPMKRGSKR